MFYRFGRQFYSDKCGQKHCCLTSEIVVVIYWATRRRYFLVDYDYIANGTEPTNAPRPLFCNGRSKNDRNGALFSRWLLMRVKDSLVCKRAINPHKIWNWGNCTWQVYGSEDALVLRFSSKALKQQMSDFWRLKVTFPVSCELEKWYFESNLHFGMREASYTQLRWQHFAKPPCMVLIV